MHAWSNENTAPRRVNGKTRHVMDSCVYSYCGLFSSLVGRCEVFAWCKRAGETAAQRRRSSPGSHALDPLLKEFCCEDTTKRRSTSEHINTETTLPGTMLPAVYCLFLIPTSTQIFVTWQKMKGFRHLCQTFCLSWSTVITWTPGLRRPEQVEISSMPSTGAAWRTFTPLFTMGYTVISTRLLLIPLLHVRAVP